MQFENKENIRKNMCDNRTKRKEKENEEANIGFLLEHV